MNTIIQEFIERHGAVALVRLLLYPLTSMVTTPIRLVQTLWASRTLLDGRWGDYSHFNPISGLSHLFYWVEADNLYRHGRSGRSNTLGLGDFELRRWVHLTLPSLYAFWLAPTITLLASMGLWWLTHLIWLDTAEPWAVWAVMGLLAASTGVYAQTFLSQNYNVVGWVFLPLLIYALVAGDAWLAAIALLAASFASVTTVIVGTVLCLASALLDGRPELIAAALPALLKGASHLGISGSTLGSTLKGIARTIGLTRQGARYVRRWKPGVGIPHLYFALLYLQFALVAYAAGADISLYSAGLLLFLLNIGGIRFADDQSLHITLVSLAAATTLLTPEPLVLVSFWLAVAPAPALAGFYPLGALDVVPRLGPFHVRPILDDLDRFLATVEPGERILAAFPDPQGDYWRIFNGYRQLIEAPLYCAGRRGIHLMPDWWAVFEANRRAISGLWGTGPEAVRSNAAKWRADYVILIREGDEPLEKRWTELGFEEVRIFDWRTQTKLLDPARLPRPTLWLLRAPKEDEPA